MYCLVTVVTKEKKMERIKVSQNNNIDFMYEHYRMLACQNLGVENVIEYDCVGISEHSAIYHRMTKKKLPVVGKGPGKYRAGNNGQ